MSKRTERLEKALAMSRKQDADDAVKKDRQRVKGEWVGCVEATMILVGFLAVLVLVFIVLR